MMKTPHTLWSNSDRTRHFLIPDQAKLPEGDFELRTVVGRQRQVTEAAAAPYEVSREEAREWLKDQLGGVLDEAREKITSTLEKARQASRERAAATLDEIPPEERGRQAEFLETLAAGIERAAAKGGARLREMAKSMRADEKEPEPPDEQGAGQDSGSQNGG